MLIPIDLTIRQKIGYRLENDIAVVWFANVDRVDDGSQQAYAVGQ